MNTLLLICIFLFPIFSIAANSDFDRCKMANDAISAELKSKKFNLSSVKNIFDANSKSAHCDDGFYGEGFSDIVIKSLAADFQNIVIVSAKDKPLLSFVLKHIDATVDLNDAQSVLKKSTENCPPKASLICNQISDVCTMAINDLNIESNPKWLNEKIGSKNPPLSVEKYSFRSQVVYLITNICCDRGFRELYNENGKLVCKLKESYSGLDYSQCPGFKKDGKWISQIYSKKN